MQKNEHILFRLTVMLGNGEYDDVCIESEFFVNPFCRPELFTASALAQYTAEFGLKNHV